MKRITLILIRLIGAATIFAQAPQSFKYQTVVRDNSGELISNQSVTFRIGIIQDSLNGILIYSEMHSLSTNQLGLASLEVGTGSVVSGVFEDISWGTSIHFLKVELDETGNTNYQLMGTSQLLSVPYCLNATSVTLTSPNGTTYEVTVDDNGNLTTNCFPFPTVANAGPDQTDACSPTYLQGNTPQHGTAHWTVENGTNGVIEEPNNPLSKFSGDPGNYYTLRWTISTSCGVSYDEVNISIMQPPTTSNAGPDQVNVLSPTTLEANVPVVGNGQWSIVSGTGGIIAQPLNPTSSFSGLDYNSYTLRWTIATLCDTTSDDVNISFDAYCPATMTDIDGNSYHPILVGSQCWMDENLKTTTYRNGTPIPNVTENSAWQNLTTGAYAWYNHDVGWKNKYGALYNWFAVTNASGLCPAGWHVPSNFEWTILINYIGGSNPPNGNKLKSCRQVNSPLGGECNVTDHPRWDEDTYSGNYGTDNYGFSALPGGNREFNGNFWSIGQRGFFWTSTTYGSGSAYCLTLVWSGGGVNTGGLLGQKNGMSVRCLRD